MMQTRLENLLSFICKGVFVLIPILFAVAQVAADGETSNFTTGWKFDPMYDHVSTYASRSPAGWAMVSCMLGFAYVLGYISWHAARRGPGFLAWLTSVVAAVAMVSTLEVAWYPMKPSWETFERIQAEIDGALLEQKSAKENQVTRNIAGFDLGWETDSSQYLTSLRSYWLHAHAATFAQKLILLTLMGAALLWRRQVDGPDFWLGANFVAVLWVGAGALGMRQQPCYTGLFQIVMLTGFFFWMWIIVREIEKPSLAVERASGAVEPSDFDECGRDVPAP